MILGEPPRTQFDLHFSLFGIPVRVHPLFWLVALLLGVRGSPDLMDLLIWIVAVFLAILVHELGHAVVMRAYGFSPWITLYGFGGLASYNPAPRYGSKGSGSLGQILISAAGPAAGFLLVALLAGALKLAGRTVVVGLISGFLPFVLLVDVVGSVVLTTFINSVFVVCVFWGYLNLLPVYPLDGGQIAREAFLKLNPREGIRQSLILSLFTAVGVAVFALLQWRAYFMALLFGYLAYWSYAMLQAHQRRGPW